MQPLTHWLFLLILVHQSYKVDFVDESLHGNLGKAVEGLRLDRPCISPLFRFTTTYPLGYRHTHGIAQSIIAKRIIFKQVSFRYARRDRPASWKSLQFFILLWCESTHSVRITDVRSTPVCASMSTRGCSKTIAYSLDGSSCMSISNAFSKGGNSFLPWL
jgi:hypothetical protein